MTTTVTHPCTGCGANVEHVPGTQLMTCPYCGKSQPIVPVQRAVAEHPFTGVPALAEPGTRVLTCSECGAQTESAALAERCAFCGAPAVVEAAALGRIPPEAVLPFAVDRAELREALRAWTASRWFAPGELKKVSVAESAQGVYLPYWTFDARTASHYEGRRGDDYWATETYTTTVNGQTQTQTRQVRRTRWRSASGNVARNFDDVLVAAGERVEPKHLEDLGSWPVHEAVAYQSEYLTGYQALRYEIEPEPAFEQAKAQMAGVIEQDCAADIGGDHQRVSEVDTRYADVTHKLLLLPIWVVYYVYAGKRWPVYLNASTGTLTGERPYSAPKIAAAVLGGLALLALIVYLFAQSRS